MGFLTRLFGRQFPDKMKYLDAMVEMANEAERTHRGMVGVYIQDVAIGKLLAPSVPHSGLPTGRGVYKARVFGAAFMAMAYTKSGPPTERDGEEMFNLATAVALEPLQGKSDVRLSREEAKTFALGHLTSVMKAQLAAFAVGPFLPGSARPEHLALADQLHDALEESIGRERYTTQARARFAVPVECNVGTALNHALRWVMA